jgi:hypothetical protein
MDKLDLLNVLKKLEDKGLLCWKDIVVLAEQIELEEVMLIAHPSMDYAYTQRD